MTDQELAAMPEDPETEKPVLFHLSPAQWKQVVEQDVRGELIEVARFGERELIKDFLGERGIDLEDV